MSDNGESGEAKKRNVTKEKNGKMRIKEEKRKKRKSQEGEGSRIRKGRADVPKGMINNTSSYVLTHQM